MHPAGVPPVELGVLTTDVCSVVALWPGFDPPLLPPPDGEPEQRLSVVSGYEDLWQDPESASNNGVAVKIVVVSQGSISFANVIATESKYWETFESQTS